MRMAIVGWVGATERSTASPAGRGSQHAPARDDVGFRVARRQSPASAFWAALTLRNSLFAFCSMILAFSPPAFAVQPDEILTDPVLERRARDLSAGLRCLVCQNQSIDDSNAPLAKDLRVLVRERLKAGESDADVKAYVVDRYGEYVLLEPPFAWHTLILWLMPLLALAGGLWAARRGMKAGAGGVQGNRLSREEESRLRDILGPDR